MLEILHELFAIKYKIKILEPPWIKPKQVCGTVINWSNKNISVVIKYCTVRDVWLVPGMCLSELAKTIKMCIEGVNVNNESGSYSISAH